MLSSDPLANPEPLIRQVYAYIAYLIGHGPDAEDVTSDVFERALRYRASYDRRKGEPLAWLLGIARRQASEAFSSRTQAAADLIETAGADDLEEQTVRNFTLAAALATLSERERELIALRYGADLTAKQIARVVGEKTNTVEVALHRALGRLRSAYAESERVAAVRNPGSIPVHRV